MNAINNITRLFVFTMLAAIVFVAAVSPADAANGKKNQAKLWQQADENTVQQRGRRQVVPEKYLVFRVNQTILKNLLAELPLENTNASREKAVVMEIPMPDGSIQRFRMEATPVLSSELSALYPTWKTFIGYGIDDPEAIGRFDWNSLGFHGYATTSKGVVVIDPYQTGDLMNYQVFYKHEFGESNAGFYCRVENKMADILNSEIQRDYLPDAPAFSFGATVRTYKIAVATTGEWTRAAGGHPMITDPITLRTNTLAVITTSVNRLNGIYERELASRFQLVNPPIANEMTNVIFDDPATDPYNNTDEIPQLTINHNTLVARVGTANFDVGHLYGTGGGGVAQSPSLCDNADKGKGYSARGTQTGDPFVVDYVAHELGHQFGSDHTYNNIDPNGMGACPQSSYSAQNAYEPGSGSTIMSYVGICGARNLQQNVDFALPMFHIRSLTVINTNITTGDPQTTGCGTAMGANNIPTVNAGAAYTIPRLTPFTLTASGADADPNDVGNLLYSWEEYDLAQQPSGVAGNPAGTFDVDTDGVQRPLFRAYSPVTSPSRTFPSLPFILNPANNDAPGSNQPALTYTGTHPSGAPGAVCETGVTCVIGERLPTINRTMNFRVSVRDRRGGVADAGTSVAVAAAAGPFRVTTQDTATNWTGNSAQTITWDVAGTTANGINAANVNIMLSTDGGASFPIMLSQNTPNDGMHQVTIPNVATTTARIKIQAVGNIFFDINNVNFTINASNVARKLFDFDGDGKADLGVFRPSNGGWYLYNLANATNQSYAFGLATDKITPADYDGDGKTDVAVYRDGTWYLLRSQLGFTGVGFGAASDIPVPADFDGDGKSELAVFRESNGGWYIYNLATNQTSSFAFGQTGDKPVPADYDGDGKADIGVFRAGVWYIQRSQLGFTGIGFGIASDKAVPADYDGDGKADQAVFRDGTWYLLRSQLGFTGVNFGQAGDVPVAADYDGDNKTDVAVFRSGIWYIQQSTAGFTGATFGAATDKPVPSAYVY